MQLNIVFHDVVFATKNITNKYTVTIDYYLKLINILDQKIKNQETLFSNYHVYFDDGYISFNNLIYQTIKDFSKFTLAIVTGDINKDGFLTDSLIKIYDKKGITISSHGVSHASLGFFKNGILETTPTEGCFKNSPKGQNKTLSENEIFYQLKKSQSYLEKILDHKIHEFVLPYGIYNKTLLQINKSNNLYQFISTCNEYLDNRGSLKPRFLINNEKSINQTINEILVLRP